MNVGQRTWSTIRVRAQTSERDCFFPLEVEMYSEPNRYHWQFLLNTHSMALLSSKLASRALGLQEGMRVTVRAGKMVLHLPSELLSSM